MVRGGPVWSNVAGSARYAAKTTASAACASADALRRNLPFPQSCRPADALAPVSQSLCLVVTRWCGRIGRGKPDSHPVGLCNSLFVRAMVPVPSHARFRVRPRIENPARRAEGHAKTRSAVGGRRTSSPPSWAALNIALRAPSGALVRAALVARQFRWAARITPAGSGRSNGPPRRRPVANHVLPPHSQPSRRVRAPRRSPLERRAGRRFCDQPSLPCKPGVGRSSLTRGLSPPRTVVSPSRDRHGHPPASQGSVG